MAYNDIVIKLDKALLNKSDIQEAISERTNGTTELSDNESLWELPILDSPVDIYCESIKNSSTATESVLPLMKYSVNGTNGNNFRGITRITKVTTEPGLTYIGPYAFYNTSLNQLNSDTPGIVNIPEGVTNVGTYAFALDATTKPILKGTTVIFPKGYKLNGTYAFYLSGVEYIDISQCASTLNSSFLSTSCFYGSALKEIDLSLTTFAGSNTAGYLNPFNGCKQLTKVKLSNYLTRICEGMFRNCTKLGSIKVPDSVTSISPLGLLYGCNPSFINFGNTRTTIPTLTAANYDICGKNTKLVLPDFLYDLWITATNWANAKRSTGVGTNKEPVEYVKYSDYFVVRPYLDGVFAASSGLTYDTTGCTLGDTSIVIPQGSQISFLRLFTATKENTTYDFFLVGTGNNVEVTLVDFYGESLVITIDSLQEGRNYLPLVGYGEDLDISWSITVKATNEPVTISEVGYRYNYSF